MKGILKNSENIKIKSLLKLGKHEIRFLLLSLILPFMLFLLIIFEVIYLSNIDNTSIFLMIYFILILFLHKIRSKCSEFDFYKAILHFFVIYFVFELIIVVVMLATFSESPILFFLSEFFSISAGILVTAFLAIGITNLFFHKKFNLKEIVIIFFFSGIISFLTDYTLLIKLVSYFSPSLITSQNDFIVSKIISVSFVISCFTGVLLYYAYKKLNATFIRNSKEIIFFTLFGLLIFLLEYANGLLAISSSVPRQDFVNQVELFILNFRYFIYFFLYGVLFKFYRTLKRGSK